MTDGRILPRLHRAAAEISGTAQSASRHPSQLYRTMSGRGVHWTFTAHDLLHVLERNGLTVSLKEESR